jgi:hypothetical protein
MPKAFKHSRGVKSRPVPRPPYVHTDAVDMDELRRDATTLFERTWPLDATCNETNQLMSEMCRFVKTELHLTWFLENHYKSVGKERTTHTTTLSMGTSYGATSASRLIIPYADRHFIYALLYSVNQAGRYIDRTYLTEMFKGPSKFKAHLEIDHVPDSGLVLNESSMSAFVKLLSQKKNCDVSAFQNTRPERGNRAHVFLDMKMNEKELAVFRDECYTDLAEICTLTDKTIKDHLSLDPATAKTRVIRAPFAKSGKAYRDDYYEPWLACAPGAETLLARDMKLTLGAWVDKASMQ